MRFLLSSGLLAIAAAVTAADAPAADRPADSAASVPAVTPAVTKATSHRPDPILRYDLNHDGALSKEEVDAIPRGKSWARIIALDTNGDGAVEADEISAAKARHAKRVPSTVAGGGSM